VKTVNTGMCRQCISAGVSQKYCSQYTAVDFVKSTKHLKICNWFCLMMEIPQMSSLF